MTYNRNFLFGLLALGFLLSCTQTPQQRAENGTVLIVVGNTDGSVGTGSGFFVERDKIATNIHVVDSGMVFAVGSKKVYNIEKVTGYDPDRDLVILKVSGKGTPLERSEGQVGEPISVVGYPGGGYKVTKGTVHGIRKSDKQLRLVAEGFPAKKDDAVLADGNSGGPVLNSEWKVIGIAVSSDEDFSFASASSALNPLLNSPDKENLSDWQERDPIRAYVYAAWGTEKLENGDYEEAIEYLNKAITLYPRAGTYSDIGQAKGNLEKHQEAIEYFGKAINLIPNNVAYYNRGIAKLKSQDYDGAIRDFDNALEFNPDHVETYRNRGIAKIRKFDPDYTSAIQDYTEAIKLKEDLADAYHNRGKAKLKNKNYAGAIDDYTEAINLKQDFAKAYLSRGNAKQESGDYADAINDYTQAINLKENYANAYYNRGHTKKTLGQDGDANLDYATAYYYWGKADSNSDNYQAAIQDFDKSIELKPDYTTYYDRGDAKREIKDYKGAIDDYTQTIKRKPDYADAYNNLGVTYALLGNYKVARGYFEQAINKKPKLIQNAHYNLGKALYYLDDHKAAINHFSKAIELKTTFAEAYEYRGKAKKAWGKHEDAKWDFVNAYRFWGIEAFEHKEYEEAIKKFDTSLESKPVADVYHRRGDAKRELGESKAALGDLEGAQNLYQEAIEDYDKAIKLQLENARFYHDRGLTKLLLSAVRNHNDHNGRIADYEAAIKDFTKAIEVYTMEAAQKQNGQNPKWISNFASAYDLRGMARCLLGYAKANQGRSKEARKQYKEALTDFEEAINLEPKKASHHKGLGLANAALGKAKAALEAFEEAKKKEGETEKEKEAN